MTSIGEAAFWSSGLISIEIPASVTSIEEAAFDECHNLIFTCPENSYAHTYAIQNEILYRLIGGIDNNENRDNVGEQDNNENHDNNLNDGNETESSNNNIENNMNNENNSNNADCSENPNNDTNVSNDNVANNYKGEISEENTNERNTDNSVQPSSAVTNIKSGDRIKVGDVTYRVLNLNKREVAFEKTKSKASNITIPQTIKYQNKRYRVTEIADNALKNNKNVKKIVIGKNIARIGRNAFKGCIRLSKITLASNVKVIGANAFSGDKKLTTLVIRSNKLTKKGCRDSLNGSYIKTIKLSGSAKKLYKKYNNYFNKKNSGKSVKIKK